MIHKFLKPILIALSILLSNRNAAVYGIWEKLMAKGLADNSLLNAVNQVK
jgi:hypothetical protein